MAKATNKINNKDNTPALPSPAATSKPLPHLLIISFIGIITWLFLKACLDNQISTWDDIPYISGNRLVKDLSWHGIKEIFSTPTMGNYHPLTMLSYAIEYSQAQLEPWLYHFDSLILHILTTGLVYWLTYLLTKRQTAALLTALLFGLHPMHVESVAWAAARKDVLCGAFYVASCIFYVYYRRLTTGKKTMLYLLTLLTYICALLSKPIAVTLPLALMLIDYYEPDGKWKTRLVEKIPFLALAVTFGIIAIKVQATAGAMDMHKVSYNAAERLALGSYALITYLWKCVVPTGLHCLYTYPDKVNGTLPYYYYVSVLAVAAIIFTTWKYLRKNKIVMFGLLFFLINIMLVLQFLPVGDALIAERYTYLPYMGLFFMAGWYFSLLFEQDTNKIVRYAVTGAVIIYVAVMGKLSAERCKVWEDDMSLWRDEIIKEPETAIQAYNNLGYIYSAKWATATDATDKQLYYDSSFYLINKAITLRPDFVNAYLALGELERNAGKYDDAKRNYFDAVKRLPRESNLYVGLAILYIVTKNEDSAGIYFRKVLELNPNAEAHGNYANYLSLKGLDDSAINEYSRAIALTKDNYTPYMNRGIIMKKTGRWDEARRDLESALKINPDAGEIYYTRSFCDTQQKNITMALQDVEKALSLGYNKVDSSYYAYLLHARNK